jgi:nicotinamide mononucleotide transporter
MNMILAASNSFDWHQLFTSPLEAFGLITGVLCVFLITVSRKWDISIRGKHLVTIDYVWNWPIGIMTSAAYVYIFHNYDLFLNSWLQVFYVATGFIGWGMWLWGGPNKTELPIQRANLKVMALGILTVIVSTLFMWQMMLIHVHSAEPFWDALVVALSLTAQLIMTRKYLEHWYFWIAVDIVGVVLFASQGLMLTSLLYLIYGCICVRGLFTWHRMYRNQETVDVNPFNPQPLSDGDEDPYVLPNLNAY